MAGMSEGCADSWMRSLKLKREKRECKDLRRDFTAWGRRGREEPRMDTNEHEFGSLPSEGQKRVSEKSSKHRKDGHEMNVEA